MLKVKQNNLTWDKVFFYILVTFYLVFIIKQVFINIKYDNGFTFGDWIINYHDGGFKRRGVFGSSAILFYDYLNIPIKYYVYFIQVFFYLATTYTLYKNVKYNPALWLIFFNPLSFAMYFDDLGVIGRKEIITIFLFSILGFYKNFNSLKFYLFCVVLNISILIHELQFFYLSIFALFILVSKNENKIKHCVILVATSCLTIALLFFFGHAINEGHTFTILEQRGISKELRGLGQMGILTWNDNFDKLALFKSLNYYLYFFSYIFSTLYFYLFLHKAYSKESAKVYLITNVVTLICSIPIYYLAIDWGRWLHIQTVLLLLFMLYYIQNHEIKYALSRKIFIFLFISNLFWSIQLVDLGFYFHPFTKIQSVLNHILSLLF